MIALLFPSAAQSPPVPSNTNPSSIFPDLALNHGHPIRKLLLSRYDFVKHLEPDRDSGVPSFSFCAIQFHVKPLPIIISLPELAMGMSSIVSKTSHKTGTCYLPE